MFNLLVLTSMPKPESLARPTFETIAAPQQPATAQSLERGCAYSLYEQIADRLRQQLVVNVPPGGQIPTEEALMQAYGVSRSTVRKAMQRLVDESVLVRKQGKGTFVSRHLPKIVHSIDRMAPFLETFRQIGEDISVEVTEFKWNETPDLPPELDSWERPVLTYQRRYISRGVPHAITRIHIPPHIGRRITRADVDSRPIYDILQKKLRLKLAQAQFLVSCRQPNLATSAALEISQSSMLLVLDRISRNTQGEPVEMTTHFLRPDVYQLSVELNDLFPRR